MKDEDDRVIDTLHTGDNCQVNYLVDRYQPGAANDELTISQLPSDWGLQIRACLLLLALVSPRETVEPILGDWLEQWPGMVRRNGPALARMMLQRALMSIVAGALYALVCSCLHHVATLIETTSHTKHTLFRFSLGSLALTCLPELAQTARLTLSIVNTSLQRVLDYLH